MARYDFTVDQAELAEHDGQRFRIDNAFDDSGTPQTDILIGGRLADGAQGFDLRDVGSFQGPDGVSTLYLKALDYRGQVVGFPVPLTGTAAGGSSPLKVITFAFDATMHAELANGVAVPDSVLHEGDVIVRAYMLVSLGSEWDGTSPTGEVYFGSDATAGLGVNNAGASRDLTSSGVNLTADSNFGYFGVGGYSPYTDMLDEVNYRVVLQTDIDAVYVVVSQDGTKGGDDAESTAGSATLVLEVISASLT